MPPGDQVSWYAQAFLSSPDDRSATLLLAADDPYQLWVNGQAARKQRARTAAPAYEQEVPTFLRAGWNQVMIKLAGAGAGWGLKLRAADPHGELRWARNP